MWTQINEPVIGPMASDRPHPKNEEGCKRGNEKNQISLRFVLPVTI
jgi:hypothetical protein